MPVPELTDDEKRPDPILKGVKRAQNLRDRMKAKLSSGPLPHNQPVEAPSEYPEAVGPSRADIAYMGLRRGLKAFGWALPAAAMGAVGLMAKGVPLPLAAAAGGLGALTTGVGAAFGKVRGEKRKLDGKLPRDFLTLSIRAIIMLLNAYIDYRGKRLEGPKT